MAINLGEHASYGLSSGSSYDSEASRQQRLLIRSRNLMPCPYKKPRERPRAYVQYDPKTRAVSIEDYMYADPLIDPRTYVNSPS